MESVYSLLSAMKGQLRQLDATSNNLANVNTPGFKEDRVMFREYYNEYAGVDLESSEENFTHLEFISPLDKGGSSFVKPDHVAPIMKRGQIKVTENKLDVALQTEGFYVVDTPSGERYTRNGQFMRDNDGFLITTNGHKVLGKKGPIQLQGEDVSFGRDGSVMVDRKLLDTLQVVNFDNPSALTKMGESYWVPSSKAQQPFDAKNIVMHQGALEGSNVETVTEMVKMINVNRSYEAAQKAIRSIDEIDGKSISIARV